MIETESVLVAMAPLSLAEIRLYAQVYQESHATSASHLLAPTVDEHLQHVEHTFAQEWNPVLSQMGTNEHHQALETMRLARLAYERKQYFERWKPVIEDAVLIRGRVYKEVFSPIVHGKESLTSKWLVKRLGEYLPSPHTHEKEETLEEREISQQTLSRWRERGLLLNNRHGHPDFDTSTSIFMLRLLQPQAYKGFLPPGSHHKQMPVMYCYRKDSPQSPISACGLPLDRNQEPIPRHALLFSPLSSLARFHPGEWLDFDGWSVRWAGITIGETGNVIWDLTEEEMALWDADIQSYQRRILRHAEATRHTLANLILLMWADRIIEGLPAYHLTNEGKVNIL